MDKREIDFRNEPIVLLRQTTIRTFVKSQRECQAILMEHKVMNEGAGTCCSPEMASSITVIIAFKEFTESPASHRRCRFFHRQIANGIFLLSFESQRATEQNEENL